MTDHVQPSFARPPLRLSPAMLMALLRAMRPHHWLKNTLVFVPILLAYKALTVAHIVQGFIAFVRRNVVGHGGGSYPALCLAHAAKRLDG